MYVPYIKEATETGPVTSVSASDQPGHFPRDKGHYTFVLLLQILHDTSRVNYLKEDWLGLGCGIVGF